MYGIFKRVVWGKNFKIDIKIRDYKTDIIIIIIFERHIDKFDVLFHLQLGLLSLQVDAVERDKEPNVDYEDECQDHSEEEPSENKDETSTI